MNEILVNLLVSTTNELGKVWEETEEQNLVPVVKIVRGTGEDSGRGSVKFEEVFLPDRFLVNLLTGRDYLSALNKRLSRTLYTNKPRQPSWLGFLDLDAFSFDI